MKKCPTCGFLNDESSLICLNCGSRLDGLIRCPGCLMFIDPSVRRCPHCGARIRPVEENKAASSSFRARKKAIDPPFQIALTVIGLICLIASLLLIWGDLLHFPDLRDPSGSISLFRIELWTKVRGMIEAGSIEVLSLLKLIFIGLLVLLQIIGTSVMAIRGIIIASRELRKGRGCLLRLDAYVAAVMVIDLLTASFLKTLMPLQKSPAFYGWAMWVILALCLIFLFLSAIYSTFQSFAKSEIPLFIGRIIASFSFFAWPLLIICGGLDAFIIEDVHYGAAGALFRFIELYQGGLHDPSFIGVIALQGINVLLNFVMILLAASLTVYLASGFRTKKERRISFKLPINVVSTVLFALSLDRLIINGVVHWQLGKLKLGIQSYGLSAPLNVMLAALSFAFSLASFIIVRKRARRARLLREDDASFLSFDQEEKARPYHVKEGPARDAEAVDPLLPAGPLGPEKDE